MSENKICPRCGNTFNCNKENIEACQCSAVQLSNNTREYLAKTQYDCLCKNCLTTLNDLVAKAKSLPFPSVRSEFVEGLHYTEAGGYWLFTEFYHIQRGQCCRSGCRNCAYGYKKRHYN